jgi:hypothetical protein
MSENRDLDTNPDGTTKPIGVDLLGQPDSESKEFNPTDFSNRGLQATATVRQAVSERGGQPK